MKIQIRQRDATMPQEDGWSEMGDWLAEIGSDGHARPPGDGHAESDGSDSPPPEAPARADARPPDPTPANPPMAAQRNRSRPLEVAQCSLCGIALPLGLLVPDGGQTCADIRWYCKDATSCTKRWTTADPPGLAHMPAAADTPTTRKDV